MILVAAKFLAAKFIGGITLHDFLTNVATVGCVVALGAAATMIASTLIAIPYNRKKMADRAARVEQRVAEAVKFETLYWAEYDELMRPTDAELPCSTLAKPVTECSMHGDKVTMVYLPDRAAFGYYTDRKNGISYPHLETIARKYLVDNARWDIAKRAYADRRPKQPQPTDNEVIVLGSSSSGSSSSSSSASAAAETGGGGGGGGGIFAMFRRYNRKPAAASAATSGSGGGSGSGDPPLEYTRFVYLGSMHDFSDEATNSSELSTSTSTSDGDSVVDYAEYKRLKSLPAPATPLTPS